MRAILTWHSIDESRSPISIAPALFRHQLEWIAAAGLRVVSVPQLLSMPSSADAVALTFDDGFVNFATEAVPLLRERGWPVTLFVVADRVGRDNAWGARDRNLPVLPLLDWPAIERLAEQGVQIENHTRTHPDLPSVSETMLPDEIDGAAAAIEDRLGRAISGIAYPYGAHDRRTVDAARRRHAWGVTTDFRALGDNDDPMALPRLDAWYFRRRAYISAWGSATFRGWVFAQRHARKVRATFVPRRVTA